jgi:glucose/arabinose dehydrogenase
MAFYTANLFPAWKGNLFVGGHETNDLVRLELNGEKVVAEERLLTDKHGTIRDVRQGPDGAIYLLADQRGEILKLVPKR